MNDHRIVAIVPMKPLSLCKSRLADALTPGQQEVLSLSMLERVVRAALESPASGVWVVGGDAGVVEAAGGLGARWLDDGGAGLNEALARVFQSAYDLGLAPMYLPADLPFVSSADIAGAVEASKRGEVMMLAPASRDGGTNAILTPVDSPFRPALGAGSFAGHRDQAGDLGLPMAVYDCPGLGFDLDTPDDLRAYEEMEPGLLRRLTEEAT